MEEEAGKSPILGWGDPGGSEIGDPGGEPNHMADDRPLSDQDMEHVEGAADKPNHNGILGVSDPQSREDDEISEDGQEEEKEDAGGSLNG